jgi:hypothetical protein
MEDPNWSKVLHVLYQEASETPTENITDDHLFVVQTDLDADDAEDAVSSLKNWDLVDRVVIGTKNYEPETGEAEKIHGYELKKEGFEVAHERELKKQQHTTNENIAFFTFILVLTAVVQAAAAALQIQGGGVSTLALIFILIMLMVLLIVDLAGYLEDLNNTLRKKIPRLRS